jgi:putative membrane protein
MKSLRYVLPGLVCLAAALVQANAQDRNGDGAALAPKEFVARAIELETLEIELGEVAKENAKNAQVRQFAEKMINAHTKSRKQLLEIAGDLKVATVAGTSQDVRNAKDRLSRAEGNELDRVYMKGAVERHQKVINFLEANAKGTTNEQIRTFARQEAAHARKHLEEAKKIQSNLQSD